MKLFTIPNLFTLGNLLCGCLAIVFAFNGDLVWSAYLVGIAAVLDFLDGFVARALNQHSPIGKDLDSLADMVTFGVVPGVVMFQWIRFSFYYHNNPNDSSWYAPYDENWYTHPFVYPLAFAAFFIPLFSALRLAKFNNDTRQSDSFIGVPTPANSILICSFPLVRHYIFANSAAYGALNGLAGSRFDYWAEQLLLNPWFLLGVVIVMSYLLISEIPLFSLKFKSFGWKGNEVRWIFLALCLVMLATLKFLAIPLTIVLYILMSVGDNVFKRKKAS